MKFVLFCEYDLHFLAERIYKVNILIVEKRELKNKHYTRIWSSTFGFDILIHSGTFVCARTHTRQLENYFEQNLYSRMFFSMFYTITAANGRQFFALKWP